MDQNCNGGNIIVIYQADGVSGNSRLLLLPNLSADVEFPFKYWFLI
jgi:hypothetical protein